MGVEDGEQDEDDGGDEAQEGGAANVTAEVAVEVADLVPVGVRVALEPDPRYTTR